MPGLGEHHIMCCFNFQSHLSFVLAVMMLMALACNSEVSDTGLAHKTPPVVIVIVIFATET